MELICLPACRVVLDVFADAAQVGLCADDVFVIIALPDAGSAKFEAGAACDRAFNPPDEGCQ